MSLAPTLHPAPGFAALPKQYLIARDPVAVPGARSAILGGWTVLAAPGVPLRPLVEGGRQTGLLIGWIVEGDRFATDDRPVEARAPLNGRPLGGAPGRYALLMVDDAGATLSLDPAGLMATVFARGMGLAASSPAALLTQRSLTPDPAVWPIFDFPARRGFFPFGLTPWEGVQRLLPNHRLDLAQGRAARIWPTARTPAPGSIGDPHAALAQAAARVRTTVEAILDAGPTVLYLSGGRDSRMVLAAARRRIDRLRAETTVTRHRTDAFLAARLARRAGIAHRILDPVPVTPADRQGWLDRTGWCVNDAVIEHVATARANNPGFLPLTGTCAELLRASNWLDGDMGQADLPRDTLLQRLRMPPAPAIMAAADRWLAAAPAGLSRTALLDLAKIEVIHGCWAAPAVYGNDIAWPSLHPFADGAITDIAWSLPEAVKASDAAYRSIVGALWPELLDVPVNRLTGLDRLRFPREELSRMLPVEWKRRLKPYR